jgi:hypothetical protein
MISVLREAIFWVAVASCFVAQVAITRSALRAKRGVVRGDADVPHPPRLAETAWTLVPAVGLALVLLATWQVIHRPASDDATAVPPAAGHVHPAS